MVVNSEIATNGGFGSGRSNDAELGVGRETGEDGAICAVISVSRPEPRQSPFGADRFDPADLREATVRTEPSGSLGLLAAFSAAMSASVACGQSLILCEPPQRFTAHLCAKRHRAALWLQPALFQFRQAGEFDCFAGVDELFCWC